MNRNVQINPQVEIVEKCKISKQPMCENYKVDFNVLGSTSSIVAPSRPPGHTFCSNKQFDVNGYI